MTCRDLMTSDPSCCLPGDSVATAAQIMKREDVGPVLVVSDHSNRRLAGIVTDRDLAIKVVAEGRDPHNTRIDEVMSPNPVTCHEDEDVNAAVRAMSNYQVRRVPIVDSEGRLTGIIAQADIARSADEEQVGEMVEEISQPFGAGEWSESGRSGGRSAMPGMSALAVGALCVGVGAGLMYIFDPTRGVRRRSMLRDKATSYLNTTSDTVRRTTEDLKNRASGAYASTRSRIANRNEPVDDEKLRLRVRSKLGHCVSNPHAVQVSAHGGHVTLSGPILASEVPAVISCVRGLAGVQSVENMLEVHDSASNHPSLQEERRTNGATWGTGMRVLSGAVGGGLMLYGLKSRSRIGRAGASLGLGLLTRGLTNREFGRLGDIAILRGIRRG